jgi:hypothetical protein
MLQLVEEVRGTGTIEVDGRVFPGVGYTLARFQGMAPSGLPIPGFHRTEGSIDITMLADARALVGDTLVLRLADGRALAVGLADETGRILTEGHGPMKCSCC